MPRLLALTVRPSLGPDTRYRIEQYVEPLAALGIQVDVHHLFNDAYYRLQQAPGSEARKGLGALAGFCRRLADLALHARAYDGVWVCRELFPLGPPLLERLLFALNPRVILDIDDAIYLHDATNTGFIHSRLRDFGKLGRIAGRFSAVVCGNAFLADYFRGRNPRVSVVPTVVPMSRYGAIPHRESPTVRIGWIGTPGNAPHLEAVRPALEALARRRGFATRVVGLNRPLGWNLPGLVQLPWSLDRELDYFSDFDIGIMPLQDFAFARGKCAFKIIQYMAAGIPVVASPVGSNLDVVRHGENGFLAAGTEEWVSSLQALLDDAALRIQIGERGRETVREGFSLESQAGRYAEIIKEALQ
ncbi:MAG: glycosyltransferase family 4 protein [Acidobacteriota bacterium]